MIKTIIWLSAWFMFAVFVIGTAKAEPLEGFRVLAVQSITPEGRVKRNRHISKYYEAVDNQRSYAAEGGRPSDCPRLWCGCWLSKYIFGTNKKELWSARAWLKFPRTTPRVGAVVVTARKGGGHVGVITGFDSDGDPIIKSGNNGNSVRTGPIGRRKVIAYVSPV